MSIGNYHSIFFLGIGGIGMSALARWFNKQGLHVSGYDRTSTTLTDELVKEGMRVHFDDAIENIPAEVIGNKDQTLIVLTPAIPADHKEYNFLKDRGFKILKRSEVLGLITKDYYTIAVAGTHGKTTTSSMIAHILKVARRDMVAFLGGVTTNYESNLIMNGEVGSKTTVVVEADEFDRSFLRLFPDIAVVTSADPDHLDIYGDHGSMVDSFREFVRQVNKDGALIINESIEKIISDQTSHTKKYVYSMSRGQFFASNITANSGFFEFDLCGFPEVERIRLGVPGFHNVENAVAASVVAMLCGLDLKEVKTALESFRGVKRRFEYIVKEGKVIYVDDYAHHPTEIEAFLRSMKSMYPGRKLTVIFQPHLYTRTRDFADGFAKSLSIADELVLMDIYPARELPIAGVDSDMIFNRVMSSNKIRCGKADLMEKLESIQIDVLATVGAGDIDTFVLPIKRMLTEKYAS